MNESNINSCARQCKTEFVMTLKQALGLPRQLVACVMDVQVGVESTGDCGPARAEAGRRLARSTCHTGANVLTWAHLPGDDEGHNNVTCCCIHTPAFVPCHSWKMTALCENMVFREHLVQQHFVLKGPWLLLVFGAAVSVPAVKCRILCHSFK